MWIADDLSATFCLGLLSLDAGGPNRPSPSVVLLLLFLMAGKPRG